MVRVMELCGKRKVYDERELGVVIITILIYD